MISLGYGGDTVGHARRIICARWDWSGRRLVRGGASPGRARSSPKVFAGGTDRAARDKAQANFTTVKRTKPPASRKGSSEWYVISAVQRLILDTEKKKIISESQWFVGPNGNCNQTSPQMPPAASTARVSNSLAFDAIVATTCTGFSATHQHPGHHAVAAQLAQ